MIKQEDKYTLPAEWHEQRAVLLAWPSEHTDWAPYLNEMEQTVTDMVCAIYEHEQVIIVTDNITRVKKCVFERMGKRVYKGIYYLLTSYNDTWMRDCGPLTLIDGQGNKLIADFRFNGWGEKFDALKDNLITQELYQKGYIDGVHIDEQNFVLEGGAIESDGKGTIFTTRFCQMAPHRNQPMTECEIEERMKKSLGAERIVWFDHGKLVGDDTDGHIDMVVRIAPNDTLLYCKDELNQGQTLDEFNKLEGEVQSLRTLDGKPYRTLALPLPGPVEFEGELLPASYANFLVINGAVLVPTYRQADNDRRAMQIIGEAFPDREIIGIDATVAIRQHGAIHCLTMQIPK